MFAVMASWSQAILAKTGDVLIAGYNLLTSLIGK